MIDSRGKCPVYEEYKDKLKAESLRKPIKDLVKPDRMSNANKSDLLTKEAELIQDKIDFEKIE